MDDGTTGTGSNGQATTHSMGDIEGKQVPYARFAEVLAERNQLRGQIATLEGQATQFATERATWERKLAEAEEARTWAGHEASLAREGIGDRDVAEFVRYQYSRAEAGKDGAKPAFEDWWKGYRESKPAVLAPFLDKPAAGAQTTRSAATSIDAGAKPVGSGAKVDPSTMTSEQYRAWRSTPDGQAALKGAAFKPS